jgi:ABC-type phosphate transport system substrate-binding protein
MKKLTFISSAILSVIFAFGHCGYTQTVQQEMVKGIIKAVGPDGLNPIIKTVAAQIGQSPEIRNQLIKEVVRSIGPDDLKDIVATVARELANDPELKSRAVRVMAAGAQPVSYASVGQAPANQGSSRIPSALLARLSKSSESGAASAEPTRSESVKMTRGDLIAVITHPSNRVRELTMDEVKKLVSGEYTNWKQVGGADLPVKVVAWTGSTGQIEDLLGAPFAKSAVKVSYLSLMIPSVNRAKGAVGLLPTRNMEQLEFIIGHNAVRKVAVRNDDHSPAVMPSQRTLVDGSYPVRTKPMAMMTLQTGPDNDNTGQEEPEE